ncbi:hypothetical protein [Tenuibacillus multivorans]|uniref:Uncharacterized protein n=1 Tax=Tenuibacillus multivorans TaxID=237069 RepID=A0A1G9X4M4_9BACI|nr:hypothetical protein [Tenuibacillus multivorans]GEL77227.1 hypothetical protein TMU01_14620 [Tenuibacillus multivorans]SDM91724.1 hypothetical protein SAMN05216498_1013 [Tenuibacillus multivorans]
MKNNNNPGDKINKVTKELMKEGVPKRASAFAASMGYLRSEKKKNNIKNE